MTPGEYGALLAAMSDSYKQLVATFAQSLETQNRLLGSNATLLAAINASAITNGDHITSTMDAINATLSVISSHIALTNLKLDAANSTLLTINASILASAPGKPTK